VNPTNNNNLDWHAAQAGQQIIKTTKTHWDKGQEKETKASDVENLVTKALGVLQENGVYAVLLYLYSRNEHHIAKPIRAQLLELTRLLKLSPPTGTKEKLEDAEAEQVLKFLTDAICNDLDTLLLVKQLWEQTLIYARYGAKARGIEDKLAKDAEKAKTEAEKVKPQP
jgi:hypothetical protein